MITITHTTIPPCKPLQAIYRRVGVNSLSCSLCIHCPVWGKDGLPQGPYLWCPVNILVDKIKGCWSAYFPHMRENQSKERGERFVSQNQVKSGAINPPPVGISYNPCTYPGRFLRCAIFAGSTLWRIFTPVNPYSTVKTTAPPVKIFYYSL